MEIQITTLPTYQIIAPAGPRLDAIRALEFKENFRAVVLEADRPIIVDMGQIDFIDSSGLGALITTAKLIAAPHTLKFANLQSLVARVFKLTHIDRVFDIVEVPIRPAGADI